VKARVKVRVKVRVKAREKAREKERAKVKGRARNASPIAPAKFVALTAAAGIVVQAANQLRPRARRGNV